MQPYPNPTPNPTPTPPLTLPYPQPSRFSWTVCYPATSRPLFPSYHPSYGRVQVLMDGLLSCNLAPWARVAFTRVLCMGPALVIALSGAAEPAIFGKIVPLPDPDPSPSP